MVKRISVSWISCYTTYLQNFNSNIPRCW